MNSWTLQFNGINLGQGLLLNGFNSYDNSAPLTTTSQGTADRMFVNQQANTLSVRLSTSKLNTYLTGIGHATVGFGSTFCGLRAQTAGTVSGVALEDSTRGGTQFTIQNPF